MKTVLITGCSSGLQLRKHIQRRIHPLCRTAANPLCAGGNPADSVRLTIHTLSGNRWGWCFLYFGGSARVKR